MPTSPELYELLQNPLIQEIGPSALFYYVKNVVLGLSFRNPWEDMSIAEWVQRIFQTPKMNIPLSAMMHGTWGGDIHKLSAPSVLGSRFRTFTAPESGLGDAREARFRYNFASKDRDISQLFRLFAGRQLFFGRHGLEVLPQALADSLSSASNVQMRLGSPVKELMYNGTREQILVSPPMS